MNRAIATALACVSTLVVPAPAGAEEYLVLYNWVDYFPPELLEKFEAETGIRVVTEFYQSNEDLLARLQAGSGNYDVIVPSDYMVRILIDEGLLQPIDTPSMQNFSHVAAPFEDPWFDPGRRYTAPNMQGTSGYVYDPSQVGGGRLEESWKEFFEPRPELVGKVVALDDQRELYQAAAFYLGVDPCTEDPAAAQRILDVLNAQRPKLAFYTSGTNPAVEDPVQAGIDAFRAGEISLAQGWDGGARLLARALPGLVYVIPVEGSALWQDSYAVPYGAWHPENARIFIDWIMDPRNIAAVSEFNGYTNAIVGSEAYMSSGLAGDQVASLSLRTSARLRPVKECSAVARELTSRVWARLWPRTVK